MKKKNKNNLKNQIGSVSIFTMLAMLFFLVVIVGAYMVTSKRAQTQIQSLGETQEKYGTEDVDTIYNQKIAIVDKIPIYTKEQLWSVGTATKIEIDGNLYDFSKNDFTKYELKNDIIINLEGDLKNSVFKDNLIYNSTNKYKTVYYYKGYYYVPTFYKEGSASYNLGSGTPTLSAQFNESTKDWTISDNVTGLTGKYYLFALDTRKINYQYYNSLHPEEHIPTGFHYLTGSVETGYVITDGINEFVWIPVKDSVVYEKQLGTNNWYLKSGSSGTDTASSLGNNVSNGISGDTLGVSSILGTTVSSMLSATATEYEIVKKAGGFWVGRYEAGIANAEHSNIAGINGWTGNSTNSANSANTYWEGKKGSIVVKQDTEPVRNITQEKSLEIANNWKSGVADETKGTVAFQSGLITGSQWDAMCKFIGWDICNTDCSSWGNYTNVVGASYTGYHSTHEHSDWVNSTTAVTKLGDGTNSWIFPTGKFVKSGASTPNTVQKNIYDVAGNVWEWTTEVPCYRTTNSVLRGGSALYTSNNVLAADRYGGSSSLVFVSWDIGLRLVLYVE